MKATLLTLSLVLFVVATYAALKKSGLLPINVNGVSPEGPTEPPQPPLPQTSLIKLQEARGE